MAYHIGYPNPDTGLINPPIEKGSTFILDFTVTDVFADDDAGATPPLLPALTLRGQYRPVIEGVTVTEFICTAVRIPATITVPIVPKHVACRLRLNPDTTKDMVAGNGFWDCELEDSTGFVMKPMGYANKAKVVKEVTRAIPTP
jgi:hypothetical protein